MEQVVKMEKIKLTEEPEWVFNMFHFGSVGENQYVFDVNSTKNVPGGGFFNYSRFNCKFDDYPNKWNLNCWDW